MVHKSTYNTESESTATVSFFYQKEGEETPKYQFTATDLPLPKGDKLYLFVGSCTTGEKFRVGKFILRGEEFLPPQEQIRMESTQQCK